MGSLQFCEDATQREDFPAISVVQLPCCRYVKHGTVCGLPPDVEYDDEWMLTDASTVRVWRDVSAAAIDVHALRIGDQPVFTRWRMAQSVRSSAAREDMTRNPLPR